MTGNLKWRALIDDGVVIQAERRDRRALEIVVVGTGIIDRADGRRQAAIPDRLHQPAIVLLGMRAAVQQ